MVARIGAEATPRQMSKTLHNGLLILEHLATRTEGATIAELGAYLEAEWSVVQRLVLTLQQHDFVRRDVNKRVHLGCAMFSLGEPVTRSFHQLVLPVLEALANDLQATSNLVVLRSEHSVRALMVVEPRCAPVHIAFRAGQVHSIHRGASGLALLSARPVIDGEREEVTRARARGYAVSKNEIIEGITGVAAPIARPFGHSIMAIGVSMVSVSDLKHTGARVLQAATRLSTAALDDLEHVYP